MNVDSFLVVFVTLVHSLTVFVFCLNNYENRNHNKAHTYRQKYINQMCLKKKNSKKSIISSKTI